MNPRTLPLWPAGQVPYALGSEATDTPTITVYPPPSEKNNGAAVLICPGGGYGALAQHEGEPVALWLNRHGATGIVLKYRLGPRYHHPVMLSDVSRALRTVRHHAEEWGIRPAHIGVLGFSAGGHLASTLSTHWTPGDMASGDPIERRSSRPDVTILIYPVIDLEGPAAHAGSRRNLLGETPDPELVRTLSNHTHVTRETPPAFLVHSCDDRGVPVQNSLLYAGALAAAGVPFAMQVFEHGGHGYGMGKDDPLLATWPEQCAAWLRKRGFFAE